jgi:hypothetical protein
MVTKGAADNRYSLLECLECIRSRDFLNSFLQEKIRAPLGEISRKAINTQHGIFSRGLKSAQACTTMADDIKAIFAAAFELPPPSLIQYIGFPNQGLKASLSSGE